MLKFLPLILFFIDGPAPSDKEMKAAQSIDGCRVVFRNAQGVGAEGALETADGVAGDVIPDRYSSYPTPAEAVKAHEKAQRLLSSKSNDIQAPNSDKNGAMDAGSDNVTPNGVVKRVWAGSLEDKSNHKGPPALAPVTVSTPQGGIAAETGGAFPANSTQAPGEVVDLSLQAKQTADKFGKTPAANKSAAADKSEK